MKTNDFYHNRDFKNSDKLYLIVKIQSAFRGYLARKRVHELYSSKQNREGMMQNMGAEDGIQNYDNAEVLVSVREN